jgi:hypothetical protein
MTPEPCARLARKSPHCKTVVQDVRGRSAHSVITRSSLGHHSVITRSSLGHHSVITRSSLGHHSVITLGHRGHLVSIFPPTCWPPPDHALPGFPLMARFGALAVEESCVARVWYGRARRAYRTRYAWAGALACSGAWGVRRDDRVAGAPAPHSVPYKIAARSVHRYSSLAAHRLSRGRYRLRLFALLHR